MESCLDFFLKCKNEIYLSINLREAGITRIEEDKWQILEDRAYKQVSVKGNWHPL